MQKSSVVEGKKLNVAQEAKEAGHVYNELEGEERIVRPTLLPTAPMYQSSIFRLSNSERVLLKTSMSANLPRGSVPSPLLTLSARTRFAQRSASLESHDARISMIQMPPSGR